MTEILSVPTPLQWSTIQVSGEDAQSFLEGQLSQEVALCGPGRWALLLDPAGIVLTALWIRGAGEQWELLVPRDLADVAHARLRRFMIRVRCVLGVNEGASDPPLVAASQLFEQKWPWVNEFARELAPHSFGTSFVAATISFTKGCFTGQELVGRMDARGASMPWRFVAASGPSIESIDHRLVSMGPPGPKGVTTVFSEGAPWRVHGIAHRSLLTDSSSTEILVEEIE